MVLPLVASAGELSVTSVIKDKPNAKMVKDIQDYSSDLTMHMTGLGLKNAVKKFDYYESQALLELRQKNCPSNVDFFERIHRPLDKIWTAKGGSVNYQIGAGNKKKLQQLLLNLPFPSVKNKQGKGKSLDKWLKEMWLPAYQYDPMGFTYMEVGEDVTYPTIKCCQDVFDYPPPVERMFEYIILKTDPRIDAAKREYEQAAINDNTGVNKDVQFYRVIDDEQDRIVRWDGEKATEIADHTYPNYYGFVPAFTNSDIWDSTRGWYISPDNAIIDIAWNHLRDRSVFVVWKLHHGFPIKWHYPGICPDCKGTGKKSASNCPTCNGSGKKVKFDPAESITLPIPKSKDDPILAPNVVGYAVPPIDAWDKMVEDIQRHFSEAHYTTWGTHIIEDSSAAPATATGRFIDVQPVNERLACFSTAAELMYTWVADQEGWFNFEKDYQGCEKNLGRRYLVESPDMIHEKLQEAIKAGENEAILRNLYMQYVDSEYEGDEAMRATMQMICKLDPCPWLTMIQAQQVYVNDPLTLGCKQYLSRFINSLGENDLIGYKDYKTLLAELESYVTDILTKLPVQETDPETGKPKPITINKKS